MIDKSQEYFDIASNAETIFKGFPPTGFKEPDHQGQYEKIKVLGFSHIKQFIETNNIDDIKYSYIDLRKKQKKDHCYIKQYDIVVPVLAATNKLSVLFVESTPKEKMIYNATVLVIRLKDTTMAKYLYIMLNSEPVQQSISKLAYREKAAISYRLTVDLIKNIKIPLLSKEQRDKIVEEYTQVQDKILKAQEQEKQYWQKINELKELNNI